MTFRIYPRLLLMAALTLFASAAAGQDAPTTRPATRPAVPAGEAPEVTAVLERVAMAYSGLSSLRLEGTVTGEYDAAGKQSRHELKFTSMLGEQGFFRHEVPGELVVAANAEATYVYFPAASRYYRVPSGAPATQPAGRELATVARQVLLDHDLSLLLALGDPAEVLRGLGKLTSEGDGLRVARPDGSTWTLAFDGDSGLLVDVEINETEVLSRAEVPDVKLAVRKIRYASTPGAPVDAEALAFAPPETAQEVEPGPVAGAGPSLAGSPAPELTLRTLEGEEVSLQGLAGKVVVVDFWASWCGPCVMAMPHLKALAEAHAADGLVILAVNLREDEATVRQFVAEHGLAVEGVTVVRDEEGNVGQRWGVQAIPFSVVVGRDGVVREVVVGVQPEKLAESVEKALAE